MYKMFDIYVLVEVGIVIFAVVSFVFLDKRYKKNHGSKVPNGFKRTEEVTIDPTTNKRLRVYYNSATGERFYHEEEDEG
ncbi:MULTISPECIES: hypothetical protein [Clostridium]|uniref:Uncharacterized protein n=1 Tax=Clostridium saccharoperbutylacetonicum N1-4(HMT) TaxID=931276 RepID=M1MDB7_9CLOT|nr:MULTISPECIES: hypothetical protein [Clostridium]AGF54388.1 hypothetical protein Cspa_c05960 [Clostridium saccharoperbutylacetonicum N1-4(HMT)]NRT59093.1 hypothetical protein [Clostridium saccharoperbutylacetonicum]NSB28282.1 hypothetical protein [Clostridium saccharoperbutylacetonicum]NSB41769.1 hypothetical protein [Clostridium saccharoperbutylacetonicum]